MSDSVKWFPEVFDPVGGNVEFELQNSADFELLRPYKVFRQVDFRGFIIVIKQMNYRCK